MKILLTSMTSEIIHIKSIQRMHRQMIFLKTVTHSKNRLLISRFTMSVLPKRMLFNLMFSEKRLWCPLCNLKSQFHLLTPEKSQLRRSCLKTTISLKMMIFWTMFLPLNKTRQKAKLVGLSTWAQLCLTPRLLATTRQRCLLWRPRSLGWRPIYSQIQSLHPMQMKVRCRKSIRKLLKSNLNGLQLKAHLPIEFLSRKTAMLLKSK